MFVLTAVEARVLGALIEKEITTPDYYPLSLNALINACNQKSNREPLMELDEDAVRQALHTLNDKGLARAISTSDSRVPKFEHHLESFNFGRREIAILCVLLLRGPQTPGELRTRTERMHRFEELSDVQSTLQRLIDRDPPLVKVLPRQTGYKEARYTHLFCGDVESHEPARPAAAFLTSSTIPCEARIAQLEERFIALQSEVASLAKQLADVIAQLT